MKDNLILGLLVAILAVVLLGSFGADDSVGGANCNGGNCTDYDAVNTSAGYYVDDVQVVDGSGDFIGTILTTESATVGTFTQGGGISSTSTRDAAAVIPVTLFDTESLVKVTSASTSITLSFPASSTMSSLIPTGGDVRSVWFQNASTSAGASIVFAGGTGATFKGSATSSATLTGDTDGLNMIRFDLMRVTTGGNIVIMATKFFD